MTLSPQHISAVSEKLLKNHIQSFFVLVYYFFLIFIFHLFKHLKNNLLTDPAWSFQA